MKAEAKKSKSKRLWFGIGACVMVIIIGIIIAVLVVTAQPTKMGGESGCCECRDCPGCDVCCSCDHPYLDRSD